MPWFHLACFSCICHHIGSGTGILLFELQKLSFLHFSCLTFFWLSCRSFPRLWEQGLTRKFRTGYVIFCLWTLPSLIDMIDSRFNKSHSVGGFMVSLFGITYWYIWGIWLPNRKGYRLQREWVIQEDGISRYVFRRVPVDST